MFCSIGLNRTWPPAPTQTQLSHPVSLSSLYGLSFPLCFCPFLPSPILPAAPTSLSAPSALADPSLGQSHTQTVAIESALLTGHLHISISHGEDGNFCVSPNSRGTEAGSGVCQPRCSSLLPQVIKEADTTLSSHLPSLTPSVPSVVVWRQED